VKLIAVSALCALGGSSASSYVGNTAGLVPEGVQKDLSAPLLVYHADMFFGITTISSQPVLYV